MTRKRTFAGMRAHHEPPRSKPLITAIQASTCIASWVRTYYRCAAALQAAQGRSSPAVQSSRARTQAPAPSPRFGKPVSVSSLRDGFGEMVPVFNEVVSASPFQRYRFGLSERRFQRDGFGGDRFSVIASAYQRDRCRDIAWDFRRARFGLSAKSFRPCSEIVLATSPSQRVGELVNCKDRGQPPSPLRLPLQSGAEPRAQHTSACGCALTWLQTSDMKGWNQ